MSRIKRGVLPFLAIALVTASGGLLTSRHYQTGESRVSPSVAITNSSDLVSNRVEAGIPGEARTASHEELQLPVSNLPGYVGFDPPSLDLGAVDWGSRLTFGLTFRNGGGKAIVITDLQTSCGCAAVERANYVSRPVGGDSSLQIGVSLDTEWTVGTKSRSITISTADGGIYTGVLTLDVVGSFAVIPSLVDFGEVGVHDEPAILSKTVVFQSSTHELSAPQTPDVDWLDVTCSDKAPGKTTISVHLRRDHLPPGISRGNIFIHTTDERVPPGLVIVHARAIQPIWSRPGRVFIQLGERQAVHFFQPDGTPAEIVAAIPSSPRITADIDSSGFIHVSQSLESTTAETTVVTVTERTGKKGTVMVTSLPI